MSSRASRREINEEASKTEAARRSRFGLRSLMVAVFVLCLPIGCIADRLHTGRREAAAIAALEETGFVSYVMYDTTNEQIATSYPKWLVDTFVR